MESETASMIESRRDSYRDEDTAATGMRTRQLQGWGHSSYRDGDMNTWVPISSTHIRSWSQWLRSVTPGLCRWRQKEPRAAD